MAFLPTSIELELKGLIIERYSKISDEKNKIPNVQSLMSEFWDFLSDERRKKIEHFISNIKKFSKDDKIKEEDKIFHEFRSFYKKFINDDIKQGKPATTPEVQTADVKKSPKSIDTPDSSKNSGHKFINKKKEIKSPNTPSPLAKKTYPPTKTNAQISKSSVQETLQTPSQQSNKGSVTQIAPYYLQNGVVGKEFNEPLNLNKIYSEGKIIDCSIEGLEKIGLGFNKENFVIQGVPKVAGDPSENYEFEITIRFETDKKTKESRRIFIKISPDPKSLWKILEPPEALGDPKGHEYNKLIPLKNGDKVRKLLCASKRGRSHAHKATYRDDDIEIDYLEEFGWAIIAVADGAGSAKLSRVGSKIACVESVKYISQMLEAESQNMDDLIEIANKEDNKENEAHLQNLLFKILAHAAYTSAKAIHTEANNRNLTIKDFHTTLLLAIHKQYDFGHFIAGFWIGDGALAIYDNNESIKLLGTPDGGQYSGQTIFLTMKKYLETEELAKRIRYHILEDFTAIFAMSDGVSDPEFGTDKNLFDHTCWDKLWEKLQYEFKNSNERIDKTLLNWLDFWAEGEHDDRSIAILY